MTEVNSANETGNSGPTEEEKVKILQECHQQPTVEHLEMNRAFERIKLYTSWLCMKQEFENYVKHCGICHKTNSKEN
jgi:hypothetical protein